MCVYYCSTYYKAVRVGGGLDRGCYYATALDIEVDPQRRRFGFRFKRAAFYMGLKSKVGLVAAKASGVTDQPQYPRL